ncbi:MAG: hypothetical protein PHI71_15280, partial [Acidiphilium sp.]|nr:hypothetical protein [Acidiphilium sp.]
ALDREFHLRFLNREVHHRALDREVHHRVLDREVHRRVLDPGDHRPVPEGIPQNPSEKVAAAIYQRILTAANSDDVAGITHAVAIVDPDPARRILCGVGYGVEAGIIDIGPPGIDQALIGREAANRTFSVRRRKLATPAPEPTGVNPDRIRCDSARL